MNILNSIFTRFSEYFNGILYIIPVMLISLTFHEYSHGYIAYRLGDPTAKDAGRLTLNPLKHLDPIGALMMILVHFGWAKPVPVNPMYFKNPKKGMMYTAIAGPVSNLILAFISSFFEVLLTYIGIYTNTALFTVPAKFFLYMTLINVGLAVFNLIPVYPLDGSRIFGYFMPEKVNDFFRRYGQYFYIVFLVLVFATDYINSVIYSVQMFIFNLLFTMWSLPIGFVFSLATGGI